MKNSTAIVALSLASALANHTSHACSCVGPRLAFLSPINADAAPLNVHVRLSMPSNVATASLVLRAHRGATVPTQSRASLGGASVTIIELIPSAPLTPLTRFEIATVDPTKHPSTTVVGTFKTGTAADTTAPRLDSIGRPHVHLNAHSGGGDCSIQGPWITLEDIVSRDDRQDGELAYAVWMADRAGTLDTTKPPDTIVFPFRNSVAIGQTSLCDPRAFTFNAANVSLAVAAVDESGNTSRAIRFRADITKNAP